MISLMVVLSSSVQCPVVVDSLLIVNPNVEVCNCSILKDFKNAPPA